MSLIPFILDLAEELHSLVEPEDFYAGWQQSRNSVYQHHLLQRRPWPRPCSQIEEPASSSASGKLRYHPYCSSSSSEGGNTGRRSVELQSSARSTGISSGKSTSYSVVNKNGFQVSMNVKQFAADELTVKTIDNCIVVEGQHEEKEDGHGVISRHFIRKYMLPRGYNPLDVQSILSADGILTVRAPTPTPNAVSPATMQKVSVAADKNDQDDDVSMDSADTASNKNKKNSTEIPMEIVAEKAPLSDSLAQNSNVLSAAEAADEGKMEAPSSNAEKADVGAGAILSALTNTLKNTNNQREESTMPADDVIVVATTTIPVSDDESVTHAPINEQEPDPITESKCGIERDSVPAGAGDEPSTSSPILLPLNNNNEDDVMTDNANNNNNDNDSNANNNNNIPFDTLNENENSSITVNNKCNGQSNGSDIGDVINNVDNGLPLADKKQEVKMNDINIPDEVTILKAASHEEKKLEVVSMEVSPVIEPVDIEMKAVSKNKNVDSENNGTDNEKTDNGDEKTVETKILDSKTDNDKIEDDKMDYSMIEKTTLTIKAAMPAADVDNDIE